ncbi:MAG TPA: 50S ribosomal protein L21 [Rhizomicrobium sp.]|jgi:large subunit ribosomal protein L21|nr:50S ribosomal protein L21 [Rhizomicrobium sp.]
MFAVIRSGGKQYRVAQDEVITVERLSGDIGDTLKLEQVLLLGGESPKPGAPLVVGAAVEATILEHGRGEKVVAFKKKRRKNTHRKRGHRQPYTKLKITAIHAGE